jgi:D-methionine transport system ATP-binding protein
VDCIDVIELVGLHKTFGHHVALENVSLHIDQGEIFGIIGKSGAGKSTLLRCINLLERPDLGQVLIEGQDIMKLSRKALTQVRLKMGMVFQHFNLLHSKTVFDNIALPLRIQGVSHAQIAERVEELLFLVELKDKANVYPSSLSGGQKQRVAIARALARNPKILLCDEATSALEPETTTSILALLKKINHFYGITIVLITHDMAVVKRLCRRLAVMDAGKLKETFALSEVFQHPNSLARQLLYQQLSPELPSCLKSMLSDAPNDRPVIRLLFQGNAATVPFISLVSQELHLNINILLANIDRFDTVTCGVLVLELTADASRLATFMQRCVEAKLSVEVLGYVTEFVG